MSAGNLDPKLIGSIPPALLKTLPAGPPPPGIQPNFTDPLTRVPIILGVGIAFLILALLCFSIRIYTQLAIAKKWKWDDLTCSLGFLCSLVHFAAIVYGCIYGTAGRHIWDVSLDKILSESSFHQIYIATIVITPALGLIKCSFFIQYYQLFRPLRWVRISVWIGAIISAVFYITVTITGFILQSPWPGESFLEGILSSHYHKFAQLSIPTGVIGMLVDWYLLILPIPAVLTLQMSIAKKLGVLIIFMTGSLAAIASIVSLYYRVRLQQNLSDPIWKLSYILVWAQIEMFAGVAASSMPTVTKFFSLKNFSLMSWGSSLKSSLTRLLSRSTREKLPDYSPRFTGWAGGNTYTTEDRERYKMKDLQSDGCEHEVAKAPRLGHPQIHFMQDIPITQEWLEDASFRPVVIGRQC